MSQNNHTPPPYTAPDDEPTGPIPVVADDTPPDAAQKTEDSSPTTSPPAPSPYFAMPPPDSTTVPSVARPRIAPEADDAPTVLIPALRDAKVRHNRKQTLLLLATLGAIALALVGGTMALTRLP